MITTIKTTLILTIMVLGSYSMLNDDSNLVAKKPDRRPAIVNPTPDQVIVLAQQTKR